METFLQDCGKLSFNELVDKDEEIGLNRKSPPKAKKTKTKDKKEKKTKKAKAKKEELAGDAELATKLAEEDTADDMWPEHLPRPPPLDPYYYGDSAETCPDEEAPRETFPSKRAMQRAFQGFSRKSGGCRHKKTGSGKGRGKKWCSTQLCLDSCPLYIRHHEPPCL